jgi:hypothetical protein
MVKTFNATMLCAILFQECVRRFPVPLCGNDGSPKQDKFVLAVAPEQIKCVVTITGDSITNAVCIYKAIYKLQIIVT